jgi:hypothetical protein
MPVPESAIRATIKKSQVHHIMQPYGQEIFTSIEQKIQSIKVCTTTRAADPMPKPK